MATLAQQTKARTVREASAKKRSATKSAGPTKNERLHAASAASAKGRALHGPTKLRADAKAGKANPGRVPMAERTGVNGGEEQTTNQVRAGRGADGAPSIKKVSRKSTRGAWAGGEKDAQLPRRATRKVTSAKARATRGK